MFHPRDKVASATNYLSIRRWLDVYTHTGSEATIKLELAIGTKVNHFFVLGFTY